MCNSPILDVCCGSRCFYFDKHDSRVLACDIRREEKIIGKNRTCYVNPDELHDFRSLPQDWENRFSAVLFDPPHFTHAGEKSWLRAKYGALEKDTWRDTLSRGFCEGLRVLKPHGVMVFKWNEYNIPLEDVLACAPVRPLLGAETPKTSLTHFVVFAKDGATEARDGLCILRPQRIKDFCALPFAWQGQYDIVVFEPPMLSAPGWTPGAWQNDLTLALAECFRILRMNGSLIFTWKESDVPLEAILKCTPEKPVIGNRLPTKAKRHFLFFMKLPDDGVSQKQWELF